MENHMVTTDDMETVLDRIMARRTEEELIRCPFCKAILKVDFCDGDGHLVTYWGEDGDQEVECTNEECEKTFIVKENVRRTFDTKRPGEEWPL